MAFPGTMAAAAPATGASSPQAPSRKQSSAKIKGGKRAAYPRTITFKSAAGKRAARKLR